MTHLAGFFVLRLKVHMLTHTYKKVGLQVTESWVGPENDATLVQFELGSAQEHYPVYMVG